MDENEVFSTRNRKLKTYTRSKKILKKNDTPECFVTKSSDVFSLSDDESEENLTSKFSRTKKRTQQRRKKNVDTPTKRKEHLKIYKGKENLLNTKQLRQSGEIQRKNVRGKKSKNDGKSDVHKKLSHSQKKKGDFGGRRDESSDSSMEILRKDVTWQEKISLLMPRMELQKQEKEGLEESFTRQYFRSLNLSVEQVEESDDTEEEMTYEWVTESRTTGKDSRSTSTKDFKTASTGCTWAAGSQASTERMSKMTAKPISSQNSTSRYTWVTESVTNDDKLLSPTSLVKNKKNFDNDCQVSSGIDRTESIVVKNLRGQSDLNSTKRRDALDIMHAEFPSDISRISTYEQTRDMQRTAEMTPKASTAEVNTTTPVKSGRKQTGKGKLMPKSSTVLFVSGHRDLRDVMPDISSIHSKNVQEAISLPSTSSKHASHIEKIHDVDLPVKLNFQTSPVPVTAQERMLTSTPTSFTKAPAPFEAELTAVPLQCSDLELDIQESRIVNSQEIVPIFTEEETFSQKQSISPVVETHGSEHQSKSLSERPSEGNSNTDMVPPMSSQNEVKCTSVETLNRHQNSQYMAKASRSQNSSSSVKRAAKASHRSTRMKKKCQDSESPTSESTNRIFGNSRQKIFVFPEILHKVSDVPICCLMDPKIKFPKKRCIIQSVCRPRSWMSKEDEIEEDALVKYFM